MDAAAVAAAAPVAAAVGSTKDRLLLRGAAQAEREGELLLLNLGVLETAANSKSAALLFSSCLGRRRECTIDRRGGDNGAKERDLECRLLERASGRQDDATAK